MERSKGFQFKKESRFQSKGKDNGPITILNPKYDYIRGTGKGFHLGKQKRGENKQED